MICSKCGTLVNDAAKFCPECGQPVWSSGADRNESHQLPIGTLLRGRYQVGKVLGQAGFGITYLGTDTLMETQVAIKEFFPSGVVSRDCTQSLSVRCVTQRLDVHYQANRARFLREAKALVKFKNIPEVVDILDFVEENNTAYIVMEYVQGMSLAKYVAVRGGSLSVDETFNILTPVMRALDTVHQGGIVHRDIAPDNIILHPMGGAKLLDFGAVRAMESSDAGASLAKSTEAILKHGFAPIEQYNSRGGLGPWTDVYAMCATIYYCLTGRVPEEVSLRITEGRHPDWECVSGLAEHQKRALEKGMALVARDRHQTVRQLLEALFPNTKILPDAPVQPPVQPPVYSPVQPPVQQPVQAPIQPPVQQPVQPPVPPVAQPSVKPRKDKSLAILGGVSAAVVVLLVILMVVFNRATTLGDEFARVPWGGRIDWNMVYEYDGRVYTRYSEALTKDLALEEWQMLLDYEIREIKPKDSEQTLREINAGRSITFQLGSINHDSRIHLTVTEDGLLYWKALSGQDRFFEDAQQIYEALEDLLPSRSKVYLSSCIPDKNWTQMEIILIGNDGEEIDRATANEPAIAQSVAEGLKPRALDPGPGFFQGPEGSYLSLKFQDAQGSHWEILVDQGNKVGYISGDHYYGGSADWLYAELMEAMLLLKSMGY